MASHLLRVLQCKRSMSKDYGRKPATVTGA
jgi:hypothetical protein